MTQFDPSIEELRERVDADLTSFLAAARNELPEAGLLLDEIDRLIGAGGKRLRPSFCYWAYRSAGGEDSPEILRAAAALELLHTFAIVHDDIMDASDERRGEPTTHAKYDVNIALLVGDLALVLADAALMGSGFSSERVLDGFRAYSRMRQQVIAGQFLDLQAASDTTISEESARKIAVLKSGRYSIEEPLAIGAALGNAPEELRRALNRFGAPLGEAFQLRDDLLGTFGDRDDLGKPVDSDIREGKRHVLFAKAVALLEGEDQAFFVEKWGQGAALGDDEIARLRSLIDSSGARRETERLLESLVATARDALGDLDIPETAAAALRELARRATDRRT
ncbi:MAG: geranylgeranyl diphosphate synthase, type [Actinomycetota bacterium]|nr:geranylgeranyl diphosphate synthase, type [Actinomycetota bacterium]